MAESTNSDMAVFKPGPIFTIAMYIFSLAVVVRTVVRLASDFYLRNTIIEILGIELLFLVLFSLTVWRPPASRSLFNFYFLFQSALVVVLIVISRDMDFLNELFLPLSFQAGSHLRGRTRQAWVAIMLILSCVPLMLIEDPLRNLALALPTMAAIVIIVAFHAAAQEEEAAQTQSRAMLNQLRETHRQLQVYASQVEELAAIEERNRLARELHDSVSQTMFSIILNLRASQMLLERDPSRLRPQLERLYELSQSALAEMRGLIAQLRPKND